MNGSLSILGGDVWIRSGLEKHKHTTVTVGHSSSQVKWRLSELSSLDVKIGTETEECLNDCWLR
jgi:hypothetical protein